MKLATRNLDPLKRETLKPHVTIIASTLVALALSPALHHPLLSFAAYAFFSRMCHQDPARSLWISAVPLAVCARCMGIYAGAAFGALISVNRRAGIAALITALVLNTADVLAELAGVHGNLMNLRFLLGLFLGGSISTLMVIPAQIEKESYRRITV